MAQLDFREALSTPGEKIFSVPLTVPAAPQLPAPDSYFPEVGLSRSAWANIVFVAIAAIGGVVCAFYFFNGADLLRAAAAWPAEFLYPRPVSTENIEAAMLPNAVDQYATNDSTSAAGKNDDGEDSSAQNPRPIQLAQFPVPAETLGSTPITPSNLPPVVPPVLPVVPPSIQPIVPPVVQPVVPPVVLPVVPPGVPQPDSVLGDVNTLVAGTGTAGQSVYQTVNQTITAVLLKNVSKVPTRSTASSARKKVASARPSVSARASATTSSTARGTQQLSTSLQSPGVVNQTMFGGGMGAVSGIGSVGSSSGVGSSGTGVSGVGTPGGISGPGVGGPGGVSGISGLPGALPGGLGGLGGNLGGIGGIGGHH